MFGLSSSGKEAIGKHVEDLFDKMAMIFVGPNAKNRHKKHLIFNTFDRVTLTNLFVEAMSNKNPNVLELDVLKSLLDVSNGYVDSLKEKTRSNIIERVDGIVKEAKQRGDRVTGEQIKDVIAEELKSAKSHMKAIAESESTKVRNIGSAMDISRVAASNGDSDPTVFFVVVKDGETCNECKRLHLNDDGNPRVWKFSDLKQGYHKRGEDNPSAFGLHPHCRCTLTYLSSGFGFNKQGRVAYIDRDHDEHVNQRK